MELAYLRIENFRNLRSVELEPGRRFNIFAGANGQGKTNLLEAIYLLGSVKSIRPQKNSELILWGEKQASVSGHIERDGHHREALVVISSNGKRVHLNGSPVRNLGDFFGTLNTVVFSPDDLMMLKGSPGERRRFLDRAVFNTRSGYLADVQAYDAVVKQRNAHLKTQKPSTMLLEVYNEQLAEYGATLTERRLSYLKDFQPLFLDTFSGIFSGEPGQGPFGSDIADTAEMTYKANWHFETRIGINAEMEVPGVEALRLMLMTALSKCVKDDIRRGFTTLGPHRDDLELLLLGREIKAFASQGQMRAMVLAMKIAEIRVLTERFGFTPILLLDDVSSELDRHRNRFLFDVLDSHPGQVFITTTHRDHIQIEGDVVTFQIEGGAIERVEGP